MPLIDTHRGETDSVQLLWQGIRLLSQPELSHDNPRRRKATFVHALESYRWKTMLVHLLWWGFQKQVYNLRVIWKYTQKRTHISSRILTQCIEILFCVFEKKLIAKQLCVPLIDTHRGETVSVQLLWLGIWLLSQPELSHDNPHRRKATFVHELYLSRKLF